MTLLKYYAHQMLLKSKKILTSKKNTNKQKNTHSIVNIQVYKLQVYLKIQQVQNSISNFFQFITNFQSNMWVYKRLFTSFQFVKNEQLFYIEDNNKDRLILNAKVSKLKNFYNQIGKKQCMDKSGLKFKKSFDLLGKEYCQLRNLCSQQKGEINKQKPNTQLLKHLD
ncbi:hypothetical protein TTHERM_00245860 (macronuclear) [Tetrahymena thermophila SB210]|uniref:Uncharacterized protein n=1 Tax=Tetrahymena thermophila (strain SB210) TaxID=312017 RepID=Q245R4_TETTS|nr:hypothetical protein TTHERM_00245860 [Tetrahymena thermophila SB210]EAS03569.1 hypothetical protein TTHERM_00245860 [Tetrahymena thermophila SB210]|eukprot:XP_001023814.1 hypothetical protein TTHERM_00245860 [Tetrahymena thermophila SB210]